MADFRMRFEDHDYDEAAPTIEALVALYGQWLNARKPAEDADPFDLQLMLDWKLGYGDGRFDIWRRSEVEEFLLQWCPRKVSMPAQWSIPMVQRVADAFLFLDDQGLLSSDGDDATKLADFARTLGPQMQVAMSNPANFGMAKGLVAGAGADFGSDLTPDSIQQIMDDFNAAVDAEVDQGVEFSKLMQVLQSRKVWASAIALLIAVALYWADQITGAQLTWASAIIAGIFTGSVALEDGLSSLATGALAVLLEKREQRDDGRIDF